jgi:hypothetical protein
MATKGNIRMLKKSLLTLTLIAAVASMSFAATNSNTATVSLTATVGSSITLSVTSPIDFATVTPGNAANAATSAATLTSSWNLAPSHTALKFYAYFSSANAMTDGAGSNIPYASFEIKGGDLGATLTPVNQTGPFSAGNSSLLFKTVAISGANKVTTGDSTTLNFNLNLTSQPTLAAGAYTGTLNIQAQATP